MDEKTPVSWKGGQTRFYFMLFWGKFRIIVSVRDLSLFAIFTLFLTMQPTCFLESGRDPV